MDADKQVCSLALFQILDISHVITLSFRAILLLRAEKSLPARSSQEARRLVRLAKRVDCPR